MESSKNDSDAQKSFHSPPRRRRSAFFEKRDSLFVSQPDTENNDPNVKLNEVDKKHKNDSQRYHDILLAEKNEWKAEVKSRQKQYRDIKEQYLIAQKDQKSKRRRIISYSMLSNEDIEFLEQKPNISQLVESQENLHKSVLQTQELYRRALELDNVILDHCKKKLCKVNDYIMQNSTVDYEE